MVGNLETEVTDIASEPLPDAKKVEKLMKLEGSSSAVLAALLTVRENADSSEGRTQALKVNGLVVDYIMEAGSLISEESEMLDCLRVIKSVSTDNMDAMLSWFASAVVMRNNILPLSAFVKLTAETDVDNSLPNLRAEFWNSHNGELLREKYYKRWLESTEEGQEASKMPETYSYRVWFQLAIPEELKSLMPSNFSDRRLQQK